jgi:leucyl aminopeptidase (aminopeptidase T)
MNVGPSDRVFVLTDEATFQIGNALFRESSSVGSSAVSFRLEEFAPRPTPRLPDELAQRVLTFAPSVTFLALAAEEGEVQMRGDFIDLVTTRTAARHAHMPNITPRLMREGMTADYNAIRRTTTAVFAFVKNAEKVHVTSPKGTDLIAQFDESFKWVPLDGLYHNPGDWGNLPDGEVFTCPATVEGVVVADVIGDYFSPKYGILPEPVAIEISKGRARNVTCERKDLEKELEAYLGRAENGRRAGEFAIGTNLAIPGLCGVLLQDEKIPGLHIAFGHPFGERTGADWSSDTHVDVIPSACTIYVDGRELMRDGHFTIPLGE